MALCFVAAACGSSGLKAVQPPVGNPLLPDLVPAPPVDIHISRKDDVVLLRFTSVLVNVGVGDFVLRGTRNTLQPDSWVVEQEIFYSTSGADLVPPQATMGWGGDGHHHWHVLRVANYRLVRLDEEGREVEGAEGHIDAKVGFCFFDSDKELDLFGPDEAVFSHETCGDEDDTEFRMGLSPGWGDTYDWSLPGQSFDISDLPDGPYRLWAVADEQGWFQEASRENNTTWVILELLTLEEGVRGAQVIEVGPEPG